MVLGIMGIFIVCLVKTVFIMKHGLANMKRKRKRVSCLFVLVLFLRKLILIYVKFHDAFNFRPIAIYLWDRRFA